MSSRRTFRFTFGVEVPPSGATTRVWVPVPLENEWQRCLGRHLPADLPAEAGHDEVTGNRMLCFSLPPSERATAFEVGFDVERASESPPRPDDDDVFPNDPRTLPELRRWLSADERVPLDGPLAEEVRALVTTGDAPLQVARRIYRHVIETFEYDGRGCTPERMHEIGDLAVACDLRRGTCTDLHGVFVAGARALGVPARFVFGFNVPRRPDGIIRGYHCWSTLRVPDGSWFPVDVSEGLKQPDRHDFYFGALDPDRVAFTCDRDVDLVPRQAGGPIDKFIFPYAESAGQEVTPALSFRFAGPQPPG